MSNKKNIFFVGIGGIGVSALARYFLSQGFNVSGSDFLKSEITDSLKNDGAKIFINHKASNINNKLDLIVASAAINKDNPELKKARDFGIGIKSYAEALGGLTKEYKTISVSGAHGKSTTTAMLSLVLMNAGFDPNVIIGTKLKEFNNTNFRKGEKKYLVIEADEYNAAFLNYHPYAAIITNIDKEHLDFYNNLPNIKKTFLRFIENIKTGGILVLNKDNKNLFSLKNKINTIAKKNKLTLCWYGIKDKNYSLAVNKIRKLLQVPGEHNISNALAVYALSRILKIKEEDILKALANFKGTWRRMDFKGKIRIANKDCLIYDDYAHHPTEIKATLAGIRQKWPKSAIICVFQPHQSKRLESLFGDFLKAFNDANSLILLDIFKVQGREDVSQNVDSRQLAEAISKKKAGPKITYLPNQSELKNKLYDIAGSSTKTNPIVIVMMGAGNIYQLTKKLVK